MADKIPGTVINKNPVATGAEVTPGGNIGFKMGTEAALKALESAENGVFYLTSDTHRLFVGNGDNSLTEINQVIIVDTASKLAAEEKLTGRFAYVVTGNQLYYCTGIDWVLVNAQAEQTQLTGFTNAISEAEGTVSVKQTVQSTNGNATGTFTVKGANGITVTGNGTEITIDGTNAGSVTLSTEAGDAGNQAKITAHSLTDSSAVIKGAGATTITGAEDGVTISSTDSYVSGLEVQNAENGFTLGGVYAGTKAGQKITTATLDPIVKVGKSDTEVHFANGIADLDVYTVSEIDAKLVGLNGMVYKGLIGKKADESGDANLPTSQVSNGDVYRLSEDAKVNGHSYKAGSMIIARGTEGGDGFISGEITWDIIENASDADTNYNLEKKGSGNGIQLKASTGALSGSLDIATNDVGGGLTVSTTNSGNDVTVKLSHKAQSIEEKGTSGDVTQTNGSDASYTAITGFEIDAYGHVVSATTGTFAVKGNKLSTGSLDVEVSGNAADVTMKVQDVAGAIAQDKLKLATSSSNIQYSSSDAGQLNINLVWGSF